MNIAAIIAKFIKDGMAALSEQEKALLKDNISLMTPAQVAKFNLAIKEEDGREEAGEEEKDESADEDDQEDDQGIDEKSLSELISKSVKGELSKQVSKISDDIVAKFVKGVKSQRKRAIDGVPEKADLGTAKGEMTRKFLVALMHNDKETLKSMHQKAAQYNSGETDVRGGYLIPEELMADVMRIAETTYGVARRNFMYLPFTGPGNERKIPTLATGFDAEWVDQAGTKPSGNPTFGLVTQTLKKLAKIIPFTEEILEDSAVNLTELVSTLFAESVAKQEDIQFFRGTGSPWTGIVNNGSVNSVALGTGEGVSAITFEKLIDMQDATPSGALSGAKYYMHRTIFSYLRKLRADAVSGNDGKGNFLLPPNKQAIEDILGYPIELTDAMPDKTTTGASKGFVIFGNLKIAAIFGDKQQIRAKLLDQATITDADGVTTLNLATEDMIALRLEERVGYVLALPDAVTVLKTGPAS